MAPKEGLVRDFLFVYSETGLSYSAVSAALVVFGSCSVQRAACSLAVGLLGLGLGLGHGAGWRVSKAKNPPDQPDQPNREHFHFGFHPSSTHGAGFCVRAKPKPRFEDGPERPNDPRPNDPSPREQRAIRLANSSSNRQPQRGSAQSDCNTRLTSARKCQDVSLSVLSGFNCRRPACLPALPLRWPSASASHRAVPKHSPASQPLPLPGPNPSFGRLWLAAAIVQSAKALAI